MKRYSAWMLAATMGIAALASLSGCSSSGGGTASTTGSSAQGGGAPAKKYKIGISIPAGDHGWTAGAVYWAEQAMKLHPEVEWTFATADNEAKQISDLETMMVKGVDAVVVLATKSEPITPTAQKLHERGILLVNVDRGFNAPAADVFIEGDNIAFGRTAAKYMAEKLNGQGNIVILEGVDCTVNTQRVTAFKEVMAGHPGIKILDSQPGEWDRTKSANVMQVMLTKHPKIDAVWSSDDDMSFGAEKAIKEAGRDKEMWLLGGGGMKEVVKAIKDGNPLYPATVTYPPSMVAVGVNQAYNILRDGKKDEVMKFMPRHMVLDVELVNKENADRFYFPDSLY